MTLTQQIQEAVDTTGRVVADISTLEWSAPTPCPGWTVRDVLNHTVGGMRIFVGQLSGRPETAAHESDWLGSDPSRAYDEAAAADLEAWSRPEALAGTVTIGLGTLPGPMAAVVHLTEVLVHGVDLAVATGRSELLDDRACLELLETMRGMGGVDAFRSPGVFGPEIVVRGDAPAHEQLAGYLGRGLSAWAAVAR